MKKKKRSQPKPTDPLSSLELCEQAIHVLKQSPARAWLWYFLGTLPFFLTLTYYLTALSESTLAEEMNFSGAVPVTFAYLWMKTCQSKFSIHLWQALGENIPEPSARKGLTWRQLTYQPFGLFLVPLSRFLILPYPLTSAFFQNLSVCEALKRSRNISPLHSAWSFANQAQMKSFTFLSFLKPALFFLVGLNWLIMFAATPFIAYSITGIENPIVRSPGAIMTVVFWMSVWMCTYITVDPVLKTFYLLRCAHLDARQTGRDLLQELREISLQVTSRTSLLLLLGFLAFFPPSRLEAANTADLDQSIEKVSQREHFMWRMPRDVIEEQTQADSGFRQWLEDQLQSLSDWIEANAEAIAEWFRKIFHRPDPQEINSPDFNFDWSFSGIAKVLLLLLLAGLIIATVILLINAWRGPKRLKDDTLSDAPDAPTPDITDEDILATEMPMDGWLDLTRDFQAKGEWRMAMRALFLAFLSRLAERRLVIVHRSKSNREYEKEISTRGNTDLSLLPFFHKFRKAFESVWYGDYPALPEDVQEFQTWLEKWGKQS
ncbi:DUF4129 domain-containing protein [Kiritimatiellota bacterium B12222]|nr:DUF4129 domain-containing protein [Kiritimatiellota bacterium B12222]